MSRWISALLAAGIVSSLLGGLQLAGAFESFERRTLDARMRALRKPERFRTDVVFLGVGQASLDYMEDRYQQGWPWPRDVWAEVLETCRRARLVVFDLFLTEGGIGDGELGEALAKHGRAMFVTPFLETTRAASGEGPSSGRIPVQGALDARRVGRVAMPVEPVLRGAKRIVSARGEPDTDGVVRRYPLLWRCGDHYYPTVALAVAAEMAGSWSVRAEPGVLRLESLAIPASPQGDLLLLYDATEDDLPRCEVVDLFEGDKVGPKGEAYFENKIVIVGPLAAGLGDVVSTPLDTSEPGPLVHATAISNLLQGTFLTRAPAWLSLGILAVLIAGASVATRLLSMWKGAVAAVALIFGYAAAAVGAFHGLVWLDVVAPTTGIVLAYASVTAINFAVEGRVRGVFRRYVSTAVVEKVLSRPTLPSLEGERKELTILFMDFAGFTSLSEMMEPVDLVKLLNEYHNEAVEEIFRTEGTLDKFIGDAIMAFWNDPLPQPDHAVRACLTAIATRDRLRALAERIREKGLPEMRARIGINTGIAVAGNMGSTLQLNYTAIGDAVNLASRLEGVNKEFGTDIIASESTYAAAKDRVEARELALIAVKGKQLPVRIFELLGRKGEVPPARLEAARRFEAGLAEFRARRWVEAATFFDGADGPSAVYAKLCARYREAPPAQDWNGVYVMEHK